MPAPRRVTSEPASSRGSFTLRFSVPPLPGHARGESVSFENVGDILDVPGAPLHHVRDHGGNAQPRDPPPEKGLDCDLVGGAESRRSAAAGPARRIGEAEARESLEIRGLEGERPEAGPIDGTEGLVEPVRRAERQTDREPHVGLRQLGDGRAVRELDHPVHDGLGVHDDVDTVEVDAEQLVRLDDLQALVHERRRVDGDLGAHGPRRVLQRVGDGDALELGSRRAAERPTAGGEQDAAHLVRGTGAQRLVDGGVLRVDRHDLAAAVSPLLGDDRPAGDEALLVGQRESLAVRQRRQRGGKAGEADDGVEDDIGLGQRSQRRERVGRVDAEVRAVGCDVEIGRLPRKQLFVAAGGRARRRGSGRDAMR